MTIRNAQDEEYFQLTPKLWQHPSGQLVIGLPSVQQDRITDLYTLTEKDAEVPETLEDFAELELNGKTQKIQEGLQRTRLRSLNTPKWEASK